MLSNLVASLPSVAVAPAMCTLCGLMCDLELPMTSRCERRNRWMQKVPSRGRDEVSKKLAEQLSKVELNSGTLIWLDACDVQTTRAAVQLARRVGATIHVGQSTGSHAVKSVMASEGWLGSSLSELSARAEVIVTLGEGIRREAPLLAERFFQSQTRAPQPHWIHISQHDSHESPMAVAGEREASFAPNETIYWPRESWFAELSKLALDLSKPSNQPLQAASATLSKLSVKLLASQQTVWLWDVDDLHFQSDELIVRRMLSIASAHSEQKRCALLPLDLNIGRVTAEETLLWLTGCPTTATWSGQHWYRSPRYLEDSLEQWTASFTSIVLVSSLASDRSLPNLPADLTIQTAQPKHSHEVQVAAVGHDCSGHLFRGDRGTVLFVEATTKSELPTAADMLTKLMENLVVN